MPQGVSDLFFCLKCGNLNGYVSEENLKGLSKVATDPCCYVTHSNVMLERNILVQWCLYGVRYNLGN